MVGNWRKSRIFAPAFSRKTMANVLYPLKFKPIVKDKIWGRELWLLSGLWEEQSEVIEGDFTGDEINDLVETFMGDLVGEGVFDRCGEQFPLLIKIIEERDWLSVQVHPDDELAEKRELGNGKTEMWYVMRAEPGAELVSGFNGEMSRMKYVRVMKDNAIASVLNHEQVSQGDVFYIPAGRVHALGPDITVAEIQQTSDTTYRIYDWDRIDVAGMRRELHVAQALDAIDFDPVENYKTPYVPALNKTVPVIDSPYFTTNLLHLHGEMAKDYSELDSFVLLMPVEGKFSLEWENGSVFVTTGEVVLIPNVLEKLRIKAPDDCKILEIYINS